MLESRIILDPELAAVAGRFSPDECLHLASIYQRWAVQLELKALLETAPLSAELRQPPLLPLDRLSLN
jgi:hypothetical protein